MDSSLQSHSPDNSDVKPSFRKPSNDTANRKYRRHSPAGGSPSSSSSGSPKHGRSRRSYYPKEDSIRMSDDCRKRKHDKNDLNGDSGHNRSGKGSDSYRHSERHSYGSSRDYHRRDDYSRHHRHADNEERDYERNSRFGRESRGSTHSDHVRRESDVDRSRENWRNKERYSRDRSDDRIHKNEDKERETAVPHHSHNDKDLSSDKSSSGRRQGDSNMDENKTSERERIRNRGGGRDDRREQHRRVRDYKPENASSQEEFRGHEKDFSGRNGGESRSKESHSISNRESDRLKENVTQKRKHDDDGHDDERDRDARNDKSIHMNAASGSTAKSLKSFHSDKAVDYDDDDDDDDGQLLKSSPFAASRKPPSSSKQVQENVSKPASEPVALSADEAEASNDLNAAKVAAMKAAELVNRNLVGSGYMSTDQKKKLLWGNKKSTDAEESGNLWGGMPLFSDRERQEKFNKLMSLRLPWYLWPIVGCERRSETGAPAR